MKRLKVTAALLLAALWLPASSHALLEHFGLIHEAHGDHHDHHEDSDGSHEHDADHHDAADGLVLAPAGKVQCHLPVFSAKPAWLVKPLAAAPRQANLTALASGLSPPGAAPPELSHRWQFFSRTALPARAPSFTS